MGRELDRAETQLRRQRSLVPELTVREQLDKHYRHINMHGNWSSPYIYNLSRIDFPDELIHKIRYYNFPEFWIRVKLSALMRTEIGSARIIADAIKSFLWRRRFQRWIQKYRLKCDLIAELLAPGKFLYLETLYNSRFYYGPYLENDYRN